MRVSNFLTLNTPLNNQRGMSTLAMAMATVIILATGVSLMMSDIARSAKTRNQLRLSLQAYTTLEQFAVRFNSAFEIRNPPVFLAPTGNCPVVPAVSLNLGPATLLFDWCQWPAQPCPGGTTMVSVGAGPLELCVTDDIDSNGASAAFCMRSATGADYCLDTAAMISKMEIDPKDPSGTEIATLEIPLKETTPWSRKLKNRAVAVYENAVELVEPVVDRLAPYSSMSPDAHAQQGAETFLTARPGKPPINASTNMATITACPVPPAAGPEWCIRCEDPDVECIQIKMCMPPGCGAFGGGVSQVVYQRIAILRPRPLP